MGSGKTAVIVEHEFLEVPYTAEPVMILTEHIGYVRQQIYHHRHRDIEYTAPKQRH